MTNKIPLNLNDKELNLLINEMGKTIHKFYIKMFERKLMNGYYKDMSLNCFVTLVCSTVANVDRNVLEWMSGIWQKTVKKNPPYENFKKHLLTQLEESFNTRIGKN